MDKKTNYEILVPNNLVENKAEDALNFAIENEKINNIAITGQYSSGKSSIIQSYFNKYVDKKEYLNISLATFEKDKKTEKINEESNSLEKTIIEKLYYSILNKYDIQRDIISAVITMIITIFINSSIYLFKMEVINNSLLNNLKLTCIFIALEIICLTSGIAYLISWMMNLSKLKLKLGNFELEVNQSDSKNISYNLLNEELDFIVKTMNIGKYKYIIFEDLDRFENPKIFERLRDLNITLNSTLKWQVKFIYAIKDDMFVSENRTKFFDFIIPVVPYVSYESSGEELLKIIKEHHLENELSEDFILDIALYIPDMRILKNTINEYIIYKKTLEKTLPSYENLFSILLYKNTCSQDFAELQRNRGQLYNTFTSKNYYINEYIKQKDSELEKEYENYQEVEKNLISKNNFTELCIYAIRSAINNDTTITLTNKDNKQLIVQHNINTENVLEDFIFNEGTTIKYYTNYSWKTDKLVDFYESNCPKLKEQYNDFKLSIDNIKNEIASRIEEINTDIENIKDFTLGQLMQKDKKIGDVQLGIYSNLVKYLLNNGYIDENYNTYINKFHEGSITDKDYTFIMNVRNRKYNDYKDKLENAEKIIKRLRNIEFKREEVLNVGILDLLLKNEQYFEKKNIFFSTLIKSDKYIEIFKYCICELESFKNKEKLIKELCNIDKDILKNIQKAKIEQRDKNLILESIIINNDIDKLESLNHIKETIIYVEENNLLNSAKLYFVKDKMDKFKIKYHDISNFKENSEVYKFIIENNRYVINYKNILQILIKEDGSNQNDIEEKNFDCISNNKFLKEYIDSQIQFYIDNVYNKLKNKQNNSVTIIKDLLNNSNISTESKLNIITKEMQKIDDILKIKDTELWKTIFNNNLIVINWNNIKSYYENFGLDEILIQFFNDDEKSNILFTKDTIIEDEINIEFVKELLLSNNLTDRAYDLILKNSKYKLNNINISELNENILLKLMNNKRIEFSNNMLENIRAYSAKMLVYFIRLNYNSIYKAINSNNLKFTLEEIEEILKSHITLTMKVKCIDMIEDDEAENITINLSKGIAFLSIRNRLKEKLSEKILLNIISNIQNVVTKIRLINLNFNQVNKENISLFLEKLGDNYSKILIDRTRPKFENKDYNRLLLSNIESLGYNVKYEIVEESIILKNTIR